MKTTVFAWEKTSPLSLPQLLLAIFLPSTFAFLGFHLVLPALVARGWPVLIAWPVVASVMLLILVVIALIFLRREAAALGISLWSRMCLRKLSLKEWGVSLGIASMVLLASMAMQRLLPACLEAIGFTVPRYMPFFLNPAVTDPMAAEAAVLSPGLPLQGSYGLVPLIGITLLLNILAEELYFRAWMLPKLSRFKAWSWVLNGTLFALYHTFQLWLFPLLLLASLGFAFVFYKSKSILPPLAAHLIGNFVFSTAALLILIAR